MAAPSKNRKRPQLLSSTRAKASHPSVTLSSRHTRTLVRNHHTLRKQLKNAIVEKDGAKVQELKAKIEAAGGLKRYQQASIQGQSKERGGDSSKVLLGWIAELIAGSQNERLDGHKPRMLEVGALKIDNACARSQMFEVERIDLHSQHPLIKEQDFMERPIPVSESLAVEGFDVVSLSLVLNFVDDPVGRGEMLKRVSAFLKKPANRVERYGSLCSTLFLVLPAACVNNSRYLDENRLEAIMKSLGYTKLKSKRSAKLAYYLWKYQDFAEGPEPTFGKAEMRSGKGRNNFAIVLR